jgi:hypothetical protein
VAARDDIGSAYGTAGLALWDIAVAAVMMGREHLLPAIEQAERLGEQRLLSLQVWIGNTLLESGDPAE